MTTVLVHELATGAEDLLRRLRTLLDAEGSPTAGKIAARTVIEAGPKPRMVLTGQFSSGKSTLIEALTDGAVTPPSGPDVVTDEVKEYPWQGTVTLVDTPGVQSGLRSHDELAMEAIGRADFLLFAVTVNLFDDASRDYLRHLAHDLHLQGQLIVVITQSGKQSAAPGIREQAVLDALGTEEYSVPIAEVDSMFYLRSLQGGVRSDSLRARSGIDHLRELINKISRDRGALAQLRQPLHLVRQLCDESQALFVVDDLSKLTLDLLAQQRGAVVERKYLLGKAFETEVSAFKSKCLTDATAFVDVATNLPADTHAATEAFDRAEERLRSALERHADDMARGIERLTDYQFNELSRRLESVAESNRATVLMQRSADISLEPQERIAGRATESNRRGGALPPVDWRAVHSWLQQGRTWWKAGDGIKASAGTPGHKVVLEVGHKFNKAFKPWEAVKISNVIGKVAKYAGVAVQGGIAVVEVAGRERQARQEQKARELAHSALVTEVMGRADGIAAAAREQLNAIIDPPMDEFLALVDQHRQEILNAEATRTSTQDELDSISAEADRLLRLE